MSDVNWNALYAYPNAGDAFAKSFQQSQETGRQNAARSAMSILATDPHNPRALQVLAKADPAAAMQYQQQLIESAKAGLAEHQDAILKGAEIIRQFNPKDQATWDQARAAAAQAGIDISQVPAQFDPAYVQGIVHIADAFKPQPSDVQLVPVQPGGSVLQYNKQTGQTQPLVVPNPGGYAPGAPAQQPQLPHVSDEQSYNAVPPGQQYIGPDGQVRVKGGQTATPSGGFPQ